MSYFVWLLYSSITMIRKNSLFCKLIRIKKSSKVLFDSYMDSFCPEKETCPICSSSSNYRIHSYYGRRIIDFIHGERVLLEVTVLRLVCESCGHTHAVLPDMVIPYSSYSLFFILRVLAEAFLRLSSRHKQEWLGILDGSETSGLDFLLGLVTDPGYSLFAERFTGKTSYSFLQSHRNPPAMS